MSEQTVEHADQEFQLHDSTILEGSTQPNERDGGKTGSVELTLIKEGFGNPRDKHYYSRALLESVAGDFAGAKMYVDHLSPEAQRALGGMPRKVKDTGGRIKRSWFAEGEDGKAEVRGEASIAQPWLWQMVEADPELLGVSINARGTSSRGQVEGKDAKIVEAIKKIGSVDWVTEAGAGGRVRELMEAQVAAEEEEAAGEALETPNNDLEEAEVETPTAGAEERTDEERTEERAEEPTEEPVAEAEAEEDEEPAEEPVEEDEVTEAGGHEWRCPECGARAHGSFCHSCGSEHVTEADADEDEVTDDEVIEDGEEDETPAPPEMTDEFREWLEGELEARVEPLAEQRAQELLQDAVRGAVERLRERHSEEIAAVEARADKRVAQVEQRHVAALEIERAGLRRPTEKELKAEFHDTYFEAETDEEGKETKPAEEVCREAVRTRIAEKKAEIEQYTESRITEGETAASNGAGEGETPAGGKRPKKARLDEKIDEQIGVAPTPDAQ